MSETEWNGSCLNLESLSRNFTSDAWRVSPVLLTSVPLVVLTCLAYFIYFFIAFPWNLLILVAVIKGKLYKEPAYLLLMNLMAVDLVWCLYVFVIDIVVVGNREFIFGSSDYMRCYFCRFYVMSTILLNVTSVTLLAAMAADRLAYVKYPMKYSKNVSLKATPAVVAASWLLSFLFSFPLLINFGEVRAFRYAGCKLHFRGSLGYICFLLVLVVPLSVLLILSNTWVMVISHRNRRAKLSRQLEYNTNVTRKVKKTYCKEKFLITNVFGGIIAFNVLFLILTEGLIMAASLTDGYTKEVLTLSQHSLNYIQPAVHPMLETCLIPKVRQLIQKTLCRHRRKKSKQYMKEIEMQ